MKNVPWYIQDDQDNLLDDLDDNTKTKIKTKKAGSVNHNLKIAALSLATRVISSAVNKYAKEEGNLSQKSILDSAVKLQEIDLNSRIELHFYMGEKSSGVSSYVSSSSGSSSSSENKSWDNSEEDSNSSTSSGGSARKRNECSKNFIEGVKNIFGERQKHSSSDLIWEKTSDNPSWGIDGGWKNQITRLGSGICSGQIGLPFIKRLVDNLEGGGGEKLVLIIQYKSDVPVWKLNDDHKDIVATNSNDPKNGSVVGFVFFKDFNLPPFWKRKNGKFRNTYVTYNIKDKKRGNENIIVGTSRELNYDQSYIDLICVSNFSGPKVNKYSHNVSVRGTYLLLLVGAITQKDIVLSSVENAFMWYLKLGGRLIENPEISEDEDYYESQYLSSFMKLCQDINGKAYNYDSKDSSNNHPWWNNALRFNKKVGLKNQDVAMVPILVDNNELPIIYFTKYEINQLYKNGNSNHFRARKNWDKLKKNMVRIRLMKPERSALEVVAEGLNIKIPGAKKCKTLKKKYKKTCQGKKKNENMMKINKTCKKLKRRMKKLSC
jgi:hypothetical protein